MSNDWYSDFVNSSFGKSIADTVGLPPVPKLRRYEPGQPLLSGPALLGTATANGNVDDRMRSAFGPDYGLVVETERGAGTKIILRVPKFRAGVRV
jgi:3-oxoacyl-[acyl-carrier protein] reductase